MTLNHLHYAIRLAEDSGDCLQAMLNQKKPYQRLADYIASEGRELTSVDIAEDLLSSKALKQISDSLWIWLLLMATAMEC